MLCTFNLRLLVQIFRLFVFGSDSRIFLDFVATKNEFISTGRSLQFYEHTNLSERSSSLFGSNENNRAAELFIFEEKTKKCVAHRQARIR